MDVNRISVFSPADRQSLRDMILRVGWNDAQADGQVQSILRFLQDPEAVVYFARDVEKPVAFVTCQFYPWNRLGQIHGLVVDPDHRRRNLAARLVGEAERFLRSRGARGVYVDTPANNEGGRRFYEAIGYRLGYLMPEYYDAGQDGVTYQKFFRAGA